MRSRMSFREVFMPCSKAYLPSQSQLPQVLASAQGHEGDVFGLGQRVNLLAGLTG